MIKRLLILSILLLTTYAFPGKPPALTPAETIKKTEEILASHVTYKEFNREVAKRTLQSFVNELDPTKTYLLSDEISAYETPSDFLADQVVKDLKEVKFTQFSILYDVIISGVERREELEKEVSEISLPKGVKASEFKDLKWCSSQEELKDRLLKIKALQYETAQTLDEEVKSRFKSRLEKIRLSRRSEILADSKKEQQQQMLSIFLKAFTASLDAHTAYFTPTEAKQFIIQVQQRLFGIGAQLRDDLNGLTIVRFLEGSPAVDTLKVGDRIVAVNKEPIVGLDIVDAVDMIRGPQGTKVDLTLIRDGEKHDFSIVRDEIVLKESRFDKVIEPYGDGVIAHLSLYSFYQDQTASSASDLRQAIEETRHQHNLKGVILDLRNNGGGLLNQAVGVSGLFIKKGIVASVKDHTGKIHHLRNFDGDLAWDGPLFVLVNKTSASAAEIVAQALQDYGRALVIGDESSYGKGSYQSFTIESANKDDVKPDGEYKVTRGLYYTVSGKSPQLHGVKADITVPGLFSGSDIGESATKFPLEPDTIDPNFEDTLADIHPLHRFKMKRLYQNNLQEPMQMYVAYNEKLKENSSLRIQNNSHYQNFLELVKSDEKIGEVADLFKKSDLQLDETKNIMKDLIFLRQTTTPPVPLRKAG